MKINRNFSILFWLYKLKATSDGKAPIWVRVTIKGKRSQFSSGQKIHPKNWNEKAEIARGTSQDAIIINRELAKIKSDLIAKHDGMLVISGETNALTVKDAYFGNEAVSKTLC